MDTLDALMSQPVNRRSENIRSSMKAISLQKPDFLLPPMRKNTILDRKKTLKQGQEQSKLDRMIKEFGERKRSMKAT